MGYAIVGYFDKNIDSRIKKLWRGMAKASVDNYLIESANNPHIKFAMYENVELEKVKMILKNMTEKIKTIRVQFKSYSFYPNERPFICIDMAVSFELLALQKRIRENCDKCAKLFEVDFFDQGKWKPDCQLTIEFEKDKLLDAIQYLSNTELPINGEINRIGIIEFHPAKQLASYELLAESKN